MQFHLTSEFKPTGDQPEAISQLVQGVNEGRASQVLLGVTGSGKTFTVANVIAQVQRPTLVLSQAVQRVQGLLPGKCRGVFCLLL